MKTKDEYEIQSGPSTVGPHAAAARGVGQAFGVLPSMAILLFAVDSMLFGLEGATMGLSLPFSCATGAVLGYIVYRAQRRFYGDDHDAALIKGLILGGLTALPSPLPALLYVPSGIVGLVHTMRRK